MTPSLYVKLAGMGDMLFIFWNGSWVKTDAERTTFAQWLIVLADAQTNFECSALRTKLARIFFSVPYETAKFPKTSQSRSLSGLDVAAMFSLRRMTHTA